MKFNTKLHFSVIAMAAMAFAGADEDKRLKESVTMMEEIMGAGDKSIPSDLFHKAACAVVVPGMKKGGFIVAAKYGRGFASCRVPGGWSAPSAMRMEGGSVGFQIGASETDIILLVMNEAGMQRLIGSKFTLGGEASVAAGPLGRDATAQTDATMKAEILSWSRSRGVFGGVALQGATLRPDEDVNKALYGAEADPKAILGGKAPVPAGAKPLLALLAKFGGSAKRK